MDPTLSELYAEASARETARPADAAATHETTTDLAPVVTEVADVMGYGDVHVAHQLAQAMRIIDADSRLRP